MSITISQQAFWQLFSEAEELPNQFTDDFDTIYRYPQELGQGHIRYIQLREGLDLTIADYQLHDHLILKSPERQHSVEFTFYLSSGHKNQLSSAFTRQYAVCGSGLAPKECYEWLANQKIFQLVFRLNQSFFSHI